MILRSLTAMFKIITLILTMFIIMPALAEAEDRVNEVERIKSYDTIVDGKEVHRIEVELKRSNIDEKVKIIGEISSRLIIDFDNTVSGKTSRKKSNSIELSDGDSVSVKEIKVNYTRLQFMLPMVLNENSYRVHIEKKPNRLIVDIDKNEVRAISKKNLDNNKNKNDRAGIQEGAVVIDAGHGGGDTGAIGGNGTTEAWVTLEVAKKVERLLTENNIEVVMTRDSDRDVSYRGSSNGVELQSRVDKTPPGASVFVSIHCNAFSNRATNGMETYYYWKSPEGYKLAKILNEELERYGGRANRGVKGSNFYVLKHATIGAASLVELAFITNPTEESLLVDDYYQEQLAKAITQGILRYLGR